MDRQTLHAELHAAQARLAANRDGALAASGLPSGLAYLALPLLQRLAAHDDQDEIADLLRALVGIEHRRVLRRALAGDLVAALRVLDGNSPLGQACAALLNSITNPDEHPALGVQMQMVVGDHGTIANAQIVQVQRGGHFHAAASDPTRERQEHALLDYLRSLQHDCRPLQLSRIDTSESRYQQPMRLEHVYIGLHTERQVALTEEERQQQKRGRVASGERLTRPLTVLEALNGTARLMLLGAPGSGKSTFVNHLVLCLAGAVLCERQPAEPQPEGGWLARLPGWSHGALLPVRVILRDFAAFVPLHEAQHGSLDLLLAYLRTTLGARAEALELITQALTAGQAMLLFDGLDEVVGAPVLSRVVESIAGAAGIYARSLVLVTCRVLDYQANPERQVRGFTTETLAPLTGTQIDRFVVAWYAELAASARQMLGNAAALRQALTTRSELRELARLPLLLTMMAVVHAGKGALPDARALLYAECVELLLLRWRQEPGQADILDQLALPQFRSSDLLALMAQIGFVAHSQTTRDPEQGAQPANLSRAQVQTLLEQAFAPYTMNDPLRRDQLVSLVLHATATRNGLLLKYSAEQGESYAFPHRTFQEFLAGYHLKGHREYYKLCVERAAEPHWQEALALMVGYQALADRELEKPLELASKLLGCGPFEQVLAGELFNLIGRERASSYDPAFVGPRGLWGRARTILHRLATEGRVPLAPATLRVRAGLALGRLCYGSLEVLCRPDAAPPLPDPRLPLAVVGPGAARSTAWQRALDAYWCEVAPGLFWYGDDRVGMWLEGALKRMRLDDAFKIARFPVTNADYARFVAAGGYRERRWWTEHGWAWLHRTDSQSRDAPLLFDDVRYNNPLQPVVAVTWYEAAAYCAWLTEQGRTQGWLSYGAEIRLPTSLEWERAARDTDKRRYPWGNDAPNAERANYDETGIGLSSPVGCFPTGAAVCGALDMAGNVMEWLATPFDTPQLLDPQEDFTPEQGVLLTYTSSLDEEEHLCCGARGRGIPVDGSSLWGFRIVWSPALIV